MVFYILQLLHCGDLFHSHTGRPHRMIHVQTHFFVFLRNSQRFPKNYMPNVIQQVWCVFYRPRHRLTLKTETFYRFLVFRAIFFSLKFSCETNRAGGDCISSKLWVRLMGIPESFQAYRFVYSTEDIHLGRTSNLFSFCRYLIVKGILIILQDCKTCVARSTCFRSSLFVRLMAHFLLRMPDR